MTNYTAKKIILKDRSGNYLIPYVDSVEAAQKDGSGNVITSTYATKTELNGKQASGSYLTGYNKGSSTTPVYINSSGVATACGNSLAVSVTGSSASCSGNAATATTLQTARTINGTSFNGSANITTANWGTARNISIADSSATNTGTAVSVNGSGAVTLKLPATIKANITGNCSGSSASCTGNAATATKATQDASGNVITSTYATKTETQTPGVTALSKTNPQLVDGSAHSITVSAATTFKLPVTVDATKFHQFIILMNMTTVSTIKWSYNGTEITPKYFYNSAPTMNTTGKYTIIGEYNGSDWVIGAMYKGV